MNNKDTEALDREDSIYEKAFAFYQQWRDPVDPSDEHTAFTSGYEHGYLAGRASMREEQRWISVTDRLPKYNVVVLIYNAPFIGTGHWERTNHAHVWRDHEFKEVPVTHWKPLPAPPTQETEEGGK